MSRRKEREAYLIDRGKTLSLDQTVWTEGMNIELFLFILGMGPGAQAPSLFFKLSLPFPAESRIDLLLTW